MVIRENPYTEENISGNIFIRTFSEDTLEEELKWHWDEEDRIISLVHVGPVLETDWMFQMDNQIPKKISESIMVRAGEWHRLIKGSGNLTLRIEKYPAGYFDSIEGSQETI